MSKVKRTSSFTDALVADLFENGAGEKATRLVMVDADGRDLGGWSKAGVMSRIKLALDAEAERGSDDAS